MNNKLLYKIKKAPYKEGIVYDIYIKILGLKLLDTYIIMMEVLPLNAIDLFLTIFSHIATPIDILTYPTDYNRDYSYFRCNKAVIRANSLYQVLLLLKGLASSVRLLNKTITMLELSDWSALFIDGTNL